MTHPHRRPHSKMMSSLFKKVLGGNNGQPPSSPPPAHPPSPDISHLTPEELRILADVIKRQEQFELQERERVKRLQEEMVAVEQQVKTSKSERAGRWRLTTGRLCRLCFKTRMSDGAGRTCSYCRKRVCGRCGVYAQARSRSEEIPDLAWICRLCQLKRDVVCRTGGWYHGAREQRRSDNLLLLGSTAEVLRRKLEGRSENADTCMSDFQSSGCDRGDSELENVPSCHASDSQIKQRGGAMSCFPAQDGVRPSRRRGSLPVTSLQAAVSYHRRPLYDQDDDEEENIDDIIRERKMSHQRRQEKRMRRRSVKGNPPKDGGSPASQPGSLLASVVTSSQGDRVVAGKPLATGLQSDSKSTTPLMIPKPTNEVPDGRPSRKTARDVPPKLAALRHVQKSSSDFDEARSSLETSQPPQFYHSSAELDSHPAGSSPALSVDAGARRKAFHQAGLHPGKPFGNGGHPQTSSSLSDSDYTSPACSLSYRSFDSAAHSFLGSEDYGQSFGSTEQHDGKLRGSLEAKQRSLGNEEEKLADRGAMAGDKYKFRSEEVLSEHVGDRKSADPEPSGELRGSQQSARLTKGAGMNLNVDRGQASAAKHGGALVSKRDRSPTHSAARASESSTSLPRTAPAAATSEAPTTSSSSRRVSPRRSRASPSSSPRPHKRRSSQSSPTHAHGSGGAAPTSSAQARIPSPRRSPPKVAVHVSPSQPLLDVQARTSHSSRSLQADVSPQSTSGGERSSPNLTFCSVCARSAEASPLGGASTQATELWDLNGQVVHTVLQKPERSFPEMFGMQLMGGIGDGSGGLVTVLRTVAPGSPAQLAGLEQGDQVMEWNGQQLTDATYEHAQYVLKATTSDTVHVLTVPRNLSGSCSRGSDLEVCNSRSSSPYVVILSASDSPTHGLGQSAEQQPAVPSTLKRRLLPKTPAEIGRESRRMSGEVCFSVEYDPPTSILYVNVVMARDLNLPEAGPGDKQRHLHGQTEEPAQQHSLSGHRADQCTSGGERAEPDGARMHVPSPFVLLRLLPDTGSRETLKTEIYGNTCNPKWEQTFVYDCFTITELATRCLELTVWSREEKGEMFLGEVLFDLRDFQRYTGATWCSLHDHDDNSPPLIRPRCLTAINSPASSRSSSFYETNDVTRIGEAQDPSRDSSQGGTNSGRGSSPTPHTGARDVHLINAQMEAASTRSAKTQKRKVKGRISRVSNSLSLSDRKEGGSDESSAGDAARQQCTSDSNMHDTSPGVQRRTSYTMDLLAPPRPLSRANSSSSFFMSDDSSDGDLYSPTPITPDRPAPEGDDITSILGPGQVPPRPANETLVCGDVKLGFNVSKGQLEVDIICVKGLQRAGSMPLPDTYIKTYLVEGQKTIQKKKTHVVKATTDPVFRRKIKYSACNVHGRHMRIVVWERPRNFERKRSLGEAVVRLDALDLSTHTMSWYKLFPVNSTDLGSTDSLSQ